MKAIAVFPKEKKVRLIEHPEPKIESPTQVKLKIIDVGICGTDREICEFKYGAPPQGCDYLILGHESLGEVIDVGSAVTTLKPGDLVVTMVRRPCHHESCIACQSGHQDFCYTGDFKERGINQLHGFMTEFVVDEEKYMVRVPNHLLDIGVLAEPLTIAEKAVREIYFIQKRLPWSHHPETGLVNKHRALVIGAGPVGLLAALVFINSEFDVTVYSLETKTDSRARIATALGAHYVSAKTDNIEKLAHEITGNLDVIFDGSGASKLAFQLVDLLGYNGVFIWTGIPGRKESIDLNAGTMMRNIVLKNQSILGSVNAGRNDFESAIRNLEALSDRLHHLECPLITRFPMESFEKLLLEPPTPDIFKSVLKI
ncbi:MAG: glucose 1-dehydrogenase [Gammaproteobacteria bacterium]|nr:glucose 1-dehydrogenase [Gammaproteobacteria bacterium]